MEREAYETKFLESSLMPAAVAVIGGGITGVQAALDVANAGVPVYLIERGPSLGGHMAQLDKTFPTNDCSTCILSPKLVEAARHALITVLALSDVVALEGTSPDFVMTVRRRPRYVDEGKCVGCGLCAEKCPMSVPNEFDLGLADRKAIHVPFPQAVPLKYAIDAEHCLYLKKGRCGLCKKVCPSGAIDFDQKEVVDRIEVGAVIVASGFDQLPPSLLPSLGHGVYPGVLTALEFERLLSPSGPTGGRLFVPGSLDPPRSIVFAQCIGSRDDRHCAHCSRFCCMASLKQALVAVEHEPSIHSLSICYLDLRTYGKGFDAYRERALASGIKLVKGKVAEVTPQDKGLTALVEDIHGGGVLRLDADLIVLAMAARPSEGVKELSRALGVGLEADGFIKTLESEGLPVHTTRKGVFAAGCCIGPKDIVDSICEASAAASSALSLFPDRVRTATAPMTHRESAPEAPRVGVFVCRCGTNIASVVDVPAVVEAAKKLMGVVHAEENLFSCSERSLEEVAKSIRDNRLNRVVVASCSPRTHEPIFRDTLVKADLNPYVLEMVNIRDQCSWVHRLEPQEANVKSIELVRMGVAKARLLEPLEPIKVPVKSGAMVVGGGLAGIAAAADLGAKGYKVTLVERSQTLGGLTEDPGEIRLGVPAPSFLRKMLDAMERSGVAVRKGVTVKSVSGCVGDFKISLSDGTSLEAGAIVLAPGAEPASSEALGHLGGVTSLDLDRLISKGTSIPGRVTFIQCVGVRNGTYGCSRFCCSKTLFQAVTLRTAGKEVNVLYRDLMFYQRGEEEMYREACRLGVRFIPYEGPIRTDSGRLIISSPIDGFLAVPTDLVVLGVGAVPSESIEVLGKMLKVPRSSEGFFLEKHPKLAPVEFAVDGVYLAGCAQYPKTATEAIVQGLAASAKASSVLSKSVLMAPPQVCSVDSERCRGCGVCEAICKFGAARLSVIGGRRVSEISPAMCKGCGVCAASCPSGAIDVKGFSDDQLTAAINALLGVEP